MRLFIGALSNLYEAVGNNWTAVSSQFFFLFGGNTKPFQSIPKLENMRNYAQQTEIRHWLDHQLREIVPPFFSVDGLFSVFTLLNVSRYSSSANPLLSVLKWAIFENLDAGDFGLPPTREGKIECRRSSGIDFGWGGLSGGDARIFEIVKQERSVEDS
ncbi:hypothetical protein Nepgr_008704 [Nepenthes gracilis]|uniref:Uncharacterized protein n=1 Tax=Nepenthes gracilis TaxID=150966 RepID=A0AAD3S9W9_NEPGR|nr:hypothetical protein Nepgr_008704 [Nepenthes gracilis]